MEKSSPLSLTEFGYTCWDNLVLFARHMIRTHDTDPEFEVLRYYAQDMSEDQAVWLSWLYVTFWDPVSACEALEVCPDPYPYDLIDKLDRRWPIGTERRGLRSQTRMKQYLGGFALVIDHTTLTEWLRTGFTALPSANWRTLYKRFGAVWGNGRSASYLMCQSLKEINGWPLEATNIDASNSSGPRAGLALLYGETDDPGTMEAQALDLHARLYAAGVWCDLENTETILCDFAQLVNGKYYIGRDIDLIQASLVKMHDNGSLSPHVEKRLYEARRATLPNEYLGELHGWTGVQKQRYSVYARTGRLIGRK